jgi:hypothetical protein
MNTTPLAPVQVPILKRFCQCQNFRIATAYQGIRSSKHVAMQWRFYCNACALAKGAKASVELEKKLEKFNSGRE